jgi:dUTP pyrophosphatase
MLDKVFFKKLNREAKSPTRANDSDAGADVYYCGEERVEIWPQKTVLLGTGLQIATPHGYVCEVKNRSGMAYKNQLLVGACVIDSGYSGEVKINLHNVSSELRVVNPGDKIAQLIFYQVGLPSFNELSEEEDLYSQTDTSSNRAANGFGSTGNK